MKSRQIDIKQINRDCPEKCNGCITAKGPCPASEPEKWEVREAAGGSFAVAVKGERPSAGRICTVPHKEGWAQHQREIAERIAKLPELEAAIEVDKNDSLISILERQIDFSLRTFGPPNDNTLGILDHIHKECREVYLMNGRDIFEWIDILILAIEGAWRAGFTPKQIVNCLIGKIKINENRKWPDYRTAEPGRAIEHIKETLSEE
jgi:hypothetical protein